ncbi:MAG: hypothetical protein JO052_00800 [Bradyrhizobium sp.]|nr:hypothetical protein [Bradyrhizobium sp.]
MNSASIGISSSHTMCSFDSFRFASRSASVSALRGGIVIAGNCEREPGLAGRGVSSFDVKAAMLVA